LGIQPSFGLGFRTILILKKKETPKKQNWTKSKNLKTKTWLNKPLEFEGFRKQAGLKIEKVYCYKCRNARKDYSDK